jgi:DNA polymerase-4
MREILYLNITAFPVAIERVLRPKLYSHPVAIAPPHSDRSLLWEVSNEAKEFGLCKGMSLAEAKKNCKDLVVLPPRPDFYKRVSQKIESRVISKLTPLYEIEKPGHIYLDMTGFEKLYGPINETAHKLQNELTNSFNLIPSVGSSLNKMVSKVAAKSVSKDICLVEKGFESKFLSPLPVTVLPIIRDMVKKDTNSIFEDLNLHTVSDILNLDTYAMEVAFGKHANLILQMAQGIDFSPILPPAREAVLFEETYLKEDTNDLIVLRNTLNNLLERATYRMRKEGLYASSIRVSLRYSDFKFVTKTKKIKK